MASAEAGAHISVTQLSAEPSVGEQQGAARSPPAKLIDLRIYMYSMTRDDRAPPHHHDNIVLQTSTDTPASALVDAVTGALEIPVAIRQLFSIWLISPHLQLQLKSYHTPFKIYKKWQQLLGQFTAASAKDIKTDKPALYLRRNAFVPVNLERRLLLASEPEEANKAVTLLYLEAMHNVDKGWYPMEDEDLQQLSQIQSSVQSTSAEDLASQKQLKLQYLEKCWSQNYYGSVMFRGKIQRKLDPLKVLMYTDRDVIVAINPECVHILTDTAPRKVLLFLKHNTFHCDFHTATEVGKHFYSSLWLEFDSTDCNMQPVVKKLQIFSRQAPMINAMINRCAEDLLSDPRLYRDVVPPQNCMEDLLKCMVHRHNDAN